MRQVIEVGAIAGKVVAIARVAGKVILDIYSSSAKGGDGVLVAHKADASPLTLADLASHRVISEGLRQLTPEIPVISEEDEESAKGARGALFWLIDPLDGTKEFLAQNGEFTVNIALVSDGVPIFGVVFAPALGLMYWGGQGLGAFRERLGTVESLRVARPVVPGETFRVVASKSHLNAETKEFIARLGRCELIQAGSSLKFCRVAEGAADVYPRLGPTCEWDTAAAHALLEAAGGFVCDLQGEPLRYGKPDVLNPFFIAASVPLVELEGA